MARCIMIQGTMSGAGKSLLCTALCRIFAREGFRTAPFKSQNMALNSAVTPDGLEIGRAQAVQAAACFKEPDVRMNPILLKPTSDTGSQLIVNGEVRGSYDASTYFAMKRGLIPDILKAYESLSGENDIIVIEGAGSPAEINLSEDDIVNMGLAAMVDAPVLLAGDIDRGGVFAQLYGTAALLEDEQKARIKGLLINKFRGDITLLGKGPAMLEKLTKIPVLGVIPWMPDVDIDDEDSLSERLEKKRSGKMIDAAVIRLPRISNFTDLSSLDHHPLMGVRYVTNPGRLGEPDLVIIPGTKSTLSDLQWLRDTGLAAQIRRRAEQGCPILGICGGYQMLGRKLSDPEGAEGGGEMEGLGLLPCSTVFTAKKTRTRTRARITQGPFRGTALEGYEIHMGRTEREGGHAFALLEDGREDGTVFGHVFGTYLHGLFDTGELTGAAARWLMERKGMKIEKREVVSHRAFQEEQFERLADRVSEALDMEAVRRIMGV